MKHISPLVPLLAAALAGCQDAGVTAPDTARLDLTNQSPVAVIRVTRELPLLNGKTRYYFSGTSSYDPDGSITQYYWYPQAYCRIDGAGTTTYYMDVPNGESCGLTLTVTDNGGATGSVVNYYVGGEEYM